MVAATDPEFKSFLYGLRMQESGGNYSARQGSTGAAGAYQIMTNNIGPWSREILGRTVTVQEFMGSPGVQDQIATGKLLKYVNQYGYRGAASAWYSGNPKLDQSTRPQPNGPTIKQYVDEVLDKAKGSGTPGVTPAIDLTTPIGNPISSGLEAINTFFSSLMSAAFWVRILQGLLGIAFIVGGVVLLMRTELTSAAVSAVL